LSRRLPSQGKTEAMNMCHYRRLFSPDRPTLILYCYKKIISILATLPTTQQWRPEHHVIGALPAIVVLFHRCLTPIVLLTCKVSISSSNQVCHISIRPTLSATSLHIIIKI
jgi:hypothetical protein